MNIFIQHLFIYLFIVFDCLAELIKNLNCFFLVLYLTNTNYTYTLMSEGKKKKQRKLLENNKWLKGIKKELVKKKQQQQKPTTNLFLDSFRMKQRARKPEIHN